MSAVPIVLVHGGGHGAWCWTQVLPELTADAIAVDLPPASIRGGPDRLVEPPGVGEITIETWVDAVLTAADESGFGQFVLVGHSLAGLTLAATAARAPERVAQLVYVSAVAPAEGTSVVDLLPQPVMEDMAEGLTERVMRERFCHDMDERSIQFAMSHVGIEVVSVVVEPVSRAAVPASLPTTFIRLLQDRCLPPDTQLECIANLEASPGLTVNVIEIDSGHTVMLSHPDELAAILNEL